MKVLHFRYLFSLLSETFIYDYVVEQKRSGVDAQVATTSRFEVASRPYEPLHLLRVPHRLHPGRLLRRAYFSQGTGQNEQRHLWHYFRRQLGELIERVRPDVIHAHFGPDGVIAAPVAHAFGVPLIVQFYGYDVSLSDSNPIWQRSYQVLFRVAERIFALSREMMEALAVRGAPRTKLREVHLAKRTSDYPFRVRSGPIQQWISVGRLTDKKGHDDAIEAVARLRAEGVSVRLIIVGEGERRARLEALIRERGLDGDVQLLGAVPHARVIDLLDESDAFVLLSKTSARGDREGTPTVLLESQAMGLPTISTLHAGIPELMPPRSAEYLVPEGDIGACAAAMQKLAGLGLEERCDIVSSGRRWVEQSYELHGQVALQAAIYREVVEQRGKLKR